ncbi:MAG: DNA repair protein RadA [bacterium]
MKKVSNEFICTNCNFETNRWQGECPGCHEWNTLVENSIQQTSTTKVKKKSVDTSKLNDILLHSEPVTKLGMPGLEDVLGGGIHESQIILIAGEPGIGKSTILLQIISNFPNASTYISGEESLSQIAKRAQRISQNNNYEKTDFVSSTDLDTVLSMISSKKYKLVIIDSIQTLVDSETAGFAGSINQVRNCTFKITEIAKKNSVAVIIVGQITKEGEIAGPKMMEHLVDTVMYFEGDRKSDLRILKSYKNRFGSVGETAIFEMKQEGLKEIADPGSYFISDRGGNVDGIAYSIVSDGSVIYAVEIQALVNKSFFQFPKRLSTNYDNNRLQMLLAVLQKKLKLNLYESDIYVNVAGGVKISDTSADLAVCAAVISSFKNKKLGNNVFIGEVGLTGNIQRTSRQDAKKRQAEKLGFDNIFSVENIKDLNELLSKL